MRKIIVKYENDCRKCGKQIKIGKQAIYEKHIGLFCIECEPKDSEKIRTFRQEAANKRADKYDEWASKRELKANNIFKRNKPFTQDHAFNTQPGHIPLRSRIIKSEDKALDNLKTAERFRNKADNLRHVRVKGDAEKRHEAKREAVRQWIEPGMMVDTCHCGILKVLKVNKKTATIEGNYSNFTHDLAFLSKPK